ncbi:MAG: hypothetical protein J7502_05560, partial [Flavisolibacter sp.]|nr:hypothetical protein [Flavisolibacter sp.]
MYASKTCFFLLAFFIVVSAKASEPPYDEITVTVILNGVGRAEIPALIQEEHVYLSVADLFTFLKIRNEYANNNRVLSGYFIQASNVYVIDNIKHEVLYQGKSLPLEASALIGTGNQLFLRLEYFKIIFSLDCRFQFRTLSVTVAARPDLPVLAEMQRNGMRSQIPKTSEAKADTVIGKTFSFFRFNRAHWNVTATQVGNQLTNYQLNLNPNFQFMGGELDLGLHLYKTVPFHLQQQQYRWRYVNNDNNLLRQVTVGKFTPSSITSLYYPLSGVGFSNKPSSRAKSFGAHTLRERTEPGWKVELYLNNRLVDFTTADNEGNFSFTIPLSYGNSIVEFRFYSEWGEEKARKKNIFIPPVILPNHQLEYVVNAGLLSDGRNSRFLKAAMDYGVGPRISISGGAEYLSSLQENKSLLFLKTVYVPAPHLVITADYASAARLRLTAVYDLSKGFQIRSEHISYQRNQTHINTSFLAENKLAVSGHFKTGKTLFFPKLSIGEAILPKEILASSKYAGLPKRKLVNSEVLMAVTRPGFKAAFNSYLRHGYGSAFAYSTVNLEYSLPSSFVIRSGMQFRYQSTTVMNMRYEVSKVFWQDSYINLSYENNFQRQIKTISLGAHLNLSSVRFIVGAVSSGKKFLLTQTATGSIQRQGKARLAFSDRATAGKAGLQLRCFIDINGNGRKDHNEPLIAVPR